MDSEEQLKAENARLVAEMVSMKKKVKLALKKQQAELQSKLEAAEQRALAAEALAASSASNVSSGIETDFNSQIDVLQISASGNGTVAFSPSSRGHSHGGSIGELLSDTLSFQPDDDSLHPQTSFGSLHSEPNAEGQNNLDRENELKEKQRLQKEVIELKKTRDAVIIQAEESRAGSEDELRLVKLDAEQHIERLTKEVDKLGADLDEANGKLADTCAQMSTIHEDLERASRENIEVKQAHLNLVTEHERLHQELEQSSAAIANAQKQIQNKTKEMDEMAAARRTAQEGQEAAMAELIHQLGQMEAAGNGQQVEYLGEDSTQLLVQEKNDLLKKLELSRETIGSLQEELSTYKDRLMSAQASEGLGSRDTSDAANAANIEAEGEGSVLQEAGTQTSEDKDPGRGSEDHEMDSPQVTPAYLEEIANLKILVEENKSGRLEAETESKRLSIALNETEQQVMRLTQELANVQGSIDDGKQSRDDKYAELDAKFGRLQKRAKQRIQEVQKEKEDVEVQLTAAGEKAAQALSKQASLQDDLERARFQAGEALRTLDAERQQLRVANIRLRDEVEDLRRMLDGKEHSLAESRLLASEKDQNILEISAKLKEAEADHDSALSEVKDKLQKAEENFKAQAADATAENEKMAETISALQAQLGIKESKLAELDAASSGEMVRLGASLEAAKGEASRLQVERKQEQEAWQAAMEKLRRKLEESEKSAQLKEIAAAKENSSYESELERQRQVLATAQADLSTSKNETAQVTKELAAYKVRAYALLQKKEAELLAAKDSDLAAAQESALKDAQREAAAASRERDEVLKALKDTVSEYEDKLATREISLLDAEQRIRDLAAKVEASKGQLLVEQEHWNNRLEQVEATWRLKCDNLEASVKSDTEKRLELNFITLRAEYSNLKAEFETFRDLVDTMVEEKDQEIARLLEDSAVLQRSVSSQQIRNEEAGVLAQESPEVDLATIQVAEQQILHLARQQAQREEEVSQCKRHIQALQEEVLDLERETRLHRQQETVLKEEVRNLERAHKRDGVDMTYLKNVILKLLQTGEVEALLPVVAMLLQFSPSELKLCQDTYNNSATGASTSLSSGTASVADHVGTPRTFFSRLSFTSGG